MIKLSRDTLYVHPLPDHLAKHVTSGRGGAKSHLVYRKSKVSSQCHTKVGERKGLSYKSIKNVLRHLCIFTVNVATRSW